ncbi:DUF1566 domain-containing protein [Legionella yabuuchiae]|uniref:DUF1566 domain-containing protein n=1 Tax=Legionella yabuuchiae TaxID=376727 RepID=UPI001F5EAA9A|nr:DUF1566 domain-containing protein [Legionella yabuuchiae]
MQHTVKNNRLTNKLMLGLLSCFIWTASHAAGPLWTVMPAPGSNPTQTVPESSTSFIQYIVQNQSGKPKKLVIQPMPGITQTTPCQLAPKGQVGSSCTLNLSIIGSALPQGGVHGGPALCLANPDGSPNLLQCYQPSQGNILNITRSDASASAIITVNPSTLLFAENSTGEVTVTNSADSPTSATNVVAQIPGVSSISVQSNTCGSSLPIGASCAIIFASGSQEGPTAIPIAGDNTNTVNVNVTVTSQPQISITSPVQQSRVVTVSGTALSLEVTNDAGSAVNANAITVSNKASCPNLSVNDSNCTSVAPGDSCDLLLTSPTPYAPCTITISGDNTANSPTTLIAFQYLNGLVFQESGGSGKVVTLLADEFTAQWNDGRDVAGTSINESTGANNTDLIINAGGCGTEAGCAAYGCRHLGGVNTPDWYLPARSGLVAVVNSLCPGGSCNFGGFSSVTYWSSSQIDIINASAWEVEFPSGISSGDLNNKFIGHPVRCVRDFPP